MSPKSKKLRRDLGSGSLSSDTELAPLRSRTNEGADWQCCLSSLLERVSYLRSSSEMSDITIQFPPTKKILKAHRFILAMSSPVFHAMFFGSWAKNETMSIELPEDSADVFDWLLDYLYCDKKEFPNVQFAVDVYNLSVKYQIDSLTQLSIQYLSRHPVSPAEFQSVYQTAILHDNEDLLAVCHQELHVNGTKILEAPELISFSEDTLVHLLQEDHLWVPSEVVVFNAIWKWGEARQASSSSGKLSSTDLRKTINSCLKYVRFLAMTTDELVEHVSSTNILSSDELMAILKNVKNVPFVPMPPSLKCSSRRDPRLGKFPSSKLHHCNLYTSSDPDWSPHSPTYQASDAASDGSYHSSALTNDDNVDNRSQDKDAHEFALEPFLRSLEASESVFVNDFKFDQCYVIRDCKEAFASLFNEKGKEIAKANWAIDRFSFHAPVELTPKVKYSVKVTLKGFWCEDSNDDGTYDADGNFIQPEFENFREEKGGVLFIGESLNRGLTRMSYWIKEELFTND